VVAPTGEVLAEAGTDEEVLAVTIDPLQAVRYRAEFPVLADRRLAAPTGIGTGNAISPW
jgi:predicted amidohydrolase